MTGLVGVVELFAVVSLLSLGVSVVIELVVPLVVVDAVTDDDVFEVLLFISLSPLPSTLSKTTKNNKTLWHITSPVTCAN